jgi:hypothetical protein
MGAAGNTKEQIQANHVCVSFLVHEIVDKVFKYGVTDM